MYKPSNVKTYKIFVHKIFYSFVLATLKFFCIYAACHHLYIFVAPYLEKKCRDLKDIANVNSSISR